jgi:hypothetical protein
LEELFTSIFRAENQLNKNQSAAGGWQNKLPAGKPVI